MNAEPTTTTPSSDEEFQAELQQACLAEGPGKLQTARQHLQAVTKNDADAEALQNLFREAHSLSGNAGLAGLQTIARVAGALEMLLKELTAKPDKITASVLRTVAQSIDLLDELHRAGATVDGRVPNWFHVLAVDDEEIARRAVDFALEKVKVKPVSARDSMTALRAAGERRFDLIISDIEMPGLTGLALCEKIRATPTNGTTPLVFVTNITDFANRAQAVLKGGNDLIAKPFLFPELGLKALIFLIKPHVSNR